MSHSSDVIVVGARCAGAAAAMLLARSGLRVTVVERGRYGTDTLSTHALMRAAVVRLNRWGLLPAIAGAGTPPITHVSFRYAGEEISFAIKPRDGVDALYAPRRTLLDRVLVDAARQAGATVIHGASVSEVIVAPGGRVQGVVVGGENGGVRTLTAGIVVGADGLRSTVASRVGAAVYRAGRHATGVIYAYWQNLGIQEYRWCFGPGVAVGVIPTNDGRTCVFAATPAGRFDNELRHDVEDGYRRVIAECDPDLAAALGPATRDGRYHGFPGEAGFFRRSAGAGWALVGDAGYFKDPLTAHGITDAFRDAELLARAIVEGSEKSLAEYQEARDEAAGTIFEVTDEIAALEPDMESLKAKHRLLNEELAREARAAAGSGDAPAA
ncbi:MAG: FAD-dependent monooxygenase [Acidobacteria bacterium]|nr:FAD-dependent monooxygenase [Acidobacteriota bacterium]